AQPKPRPSTPTPRQATRPTSSTRSTTPIIPILPATLVRDAPPASGAHAESPGYSAARPPYRAVGAPIRSRAAPAARPASQAAPVMGDAHPKLSSATAAPVASATVATPATVAPARQRMIERARSLAQAAFINPNFAKLFWGQAISSVGDYAWDTALVLWIASNVAAGQSWAPLAVAGVILAAAIPQIVVGPIAGVFVDRWDKRRTMIIATALQALLAVGLIVAPGVIWRPFGGGLLSIGWRLGVVYADVALISSCSQFFLPAQLALIKGIVPTEKQDQAVETSQATQGLAIILGPPVAAALVFGVGVAWALLLNALSFVVSLGAAFAIRYAPTDGDLRSDAHEHFSREFLAGLGYVWGHRVLRTILIAESLTWLGFGALQALGYFFITQNLHAPASAYGWLGADFGVGAIAGALLVTFLGQRIGLARLLWIALIISGVFVVTLSHLTNFYLVLGAAFLFGVAATAILIASGPLTLDATAPDFVGRVTSVINPIGRLAALLSVVLAGVLVSVVLRGFHASALGLTFTPVDTVLSGMGALAVIGGLYTRKNLGGMIH
ncbi:MAG TPA: MFS transporter, partial [Ktedonobacterales bacterium]|nr:MFS transporter [Ktedonobacterales bacterium]